jgi:hypothetical protein
VAVEVIETHTPTLKMVVEEQVAQTVALVCLTQLERGDEQVVAPAMMALPFLQTRETVAEVQKTALDSQAVHLVAVASQKNPTQSLAGSEPALQAVQVVALVQSLQLVEQAVQMFFLVVASTDMKYPSRHAEMVSAAEQAATPAPEQVTHFPLTRENPELQAVQVAPSKLETAQLGRAVVSIA